MTTFLWVCAGGALGSGARYLVSGWVLRAAGPSFAYGTLTVNLAGSFLLAMILQATLSGAMVSPGLRIALTTGAMGGFTTYSTFSYETLEYMQSGAWALAATNIAVTVIGCLVASVFGFYVGRWLVGQ